MTTPVNKIIQTLDSILEQCKDKKDLATHNQIKDSSIYYEGMVDVIRYAINTFNSFSVEDEKEWVSWVYEAGFIDGVDGKRAINRTGAENKTIEQLVPNSYLNTKSN